jgi:hypothetical protein
VEVEVALIRLEDVHHLLFVAAAEVEVVGLEVVPSGSRSCRSAMLSGLRTSATHRSTLGDEVLAQEQQGALWRMGTRRTH